MTDRSNIPADLKRKVLVEAGHRCAIPRCRYNRVEIAHIIPYSEVQEHKFENLIALCPNCHDLYDKDKKIDRKSMKEYKQNLSLLNSRYNEVERRILENFIGKSSNDVQLPGAFGLMVYYLLKDGLLKKTDRSGPPINGIPSWEIYELSTEGRLFIEGWKDGKPLD